MDTMTATIIQLLNLITSDAEPDLRRAAAEELARVSENAGWIAALKSALSQADTLGSL